MVSTVSFQVNDINRSLDFALRFREGHGVLNPDKPTIECYFLANDDVVARTDPELSVIRYNLFYLLYDYLHFGKDEKLRIEIDNFMKSNPVPSDNNFSVFADNISALSNRIFKDWNDRFFRKEDVDKCIPVSVIVFQLEHLVFKNSIKTPEKPEDIFLYNSIDETIGYYTRDYLFRGLPRDEMTRQANLSFCVLNMKHFIEAHNNLPSQEIYQNFIEFHEALKIISDSDIRQIYRAYGKNVTLPDFLKKIKDISKKSEVGKYHG